MNNEESDGHNGSFHENILDDLIEYIESSLEEEISLRDVSEKAGYSYWHLQRLFKKQTGFTLGGYIRHRRLTNAAIMLMTTSLTVREISEKFKFDSQQSFNKRFKMFFSMTPTKYRSQTDISTSKLTPPYKRKPEFGAYKIELIDLPAQFISGTQTTVIAKLDDVIRSRSELERAQLYSSLGILNSSDESIIAYAFEMPGRTHSSGQQKYTVNVTISNKCRTQTAVSEFIDEGKFLHVHGQFTLPEYRDCKMFIYKDILCSMQLKRRSSTELEKVKLINRDLGIYSISVFIPVSDLH